MHRLPKMIVQKKKKKPTLFSIKKITPKYDALRFFDRTQRRFVYIVITVFRAHGRCRREILPVSCSDKKKGKKMTFLFAGEGPNLCSCTRDSYRLLGAPAQSGLGSVCCTILVKLIAGRWKEAAGWTEAPWRQNTSVRGGKESVKNVLLCTAQSPRFTFVL